ncbi:MAG: type I DNA topoisomerase, partial [Fimbriimonadales bacterium]
LNGDDVIRVPVVQVARACPNCGAPMVRREGRYGAFLACSRYPDCKTTLPIGATGIRCPLCKVGEVVERKSKGKKARLYYTCSQKECNLLLWDKPTGALCPECNSPLVERVQKRQNKRIIFCSNPECRYQVEEELEAETDVPAEAVGVE